MKVYSDEFEVIELNSLIEEGYTKESIDEWLDTYGLTYNSLVAIVNVNDHIFTTANEYDDYTADDDIDYSPDDFQYDVDENNIINESEQDGKYIVIIEK